MKKAANLLLSVMVLAVFISAFSSCGEDEKKTAEVSFDISAQTVDEDEVEIFIPYELKNGPTDDDATISFSFSGTATEDEDYVFTGWDDDGVVIELIDDNTVESNETIIVTMTSGDNVDIGQADTHTVMMQDNDFADLEIELTWDAGSGTPGDVDMDLILFEDTGVGFDFIGASDAGGTVFESITLSSSESEASYGVSFQYYSGSSDNLTFTVTYTTTEGTLEGTEDELSFSETYTLDNVNPTASVYIEQTFDQEGSDFNNFSAIDVPDEGSRVKSFKFPSQKGQKNSVTKRITVKKIGK